MNLALLLWCTAAVVTAAETLLLVLARRPVAVRAVRVGAAAAVLAAARLALIGGGIPLQTGWDVGLLVAAMAVAAVLLACRRIWLAHVDAEQFRAQVTTAARGLFLKCEEPASGCFALTTKGTTRNLRWIRLADRWSLVVLPRRAGRDKISLLISWLDKQYSGPIPRPRIMLKGSEP